MKTVASTRDQTDGRLVLIGVVIADSRWSSNDGSKSHGGLRYVNGDDLFQITSLQMLRTRVVQLIRAQIGVKRWME